MVSKPPTVACTSCDRTWMSASMAEGLRLLGRCPRCGGTLKFASDASGEPATAKVAPEQADSMAPHLVLGIPRRFD
jgi:hypothetical protein